MIEIWLPTRKQGYEVSNMGRVRSMSRIVTTSNGFERHYKGRILVPTQTGPGYKKDNGYLMVMLGAGTPGQIHRLVAEAFVPNPHNLPEVNHKDGNKKNCRADNLEWVTHKGNMEHASRTGLARGGSMPGELHPNRKLDEEDVREILKDKRRTSVLARLYQVAENTIRRIRKRENWSHIKV